MLADAARQLPEEQTDGKVGAIEGSCVRPADLDPLGQIGRSVRTLRETPVRSNIGWEGQPPPGSDVAEDEPPPVWPTGLAINLSPGVAALLLTTGACVRRPATCREASASLEQPAGADGVADCS